MDESYSEGISIAELLGIVKNHIVLFLIICIGIVALSVGYTLIISTPTYTATTTISVEPIANLINNIETKSTSTNIANEIQYLSSSSVVTKALRSMDLGAFTHKDGTDYSDLLIEENKVNSLVSKIEVSEIKGSNLIIVSFEHPNQEFANAFLASLYTAFDVRLSELSDKPLDKEHRFLETKLEEAMNAVAASELSRDEFQSNPKYLESIANTENNQTILSFLKVKIRDVEPISISSDTANALETLGIADPITTKIVETYSQSYRTLLFYEIGQLVYQANPNATVNKDNPIELYRATLDNQRLALLNQLSSIKGKTEAEKLLDPLISTIEYSLLVVERQYYLDTLGEFKAISILADNVENELGKYKEDVIQYKTKLQSLESFRSNAVNPTSIVEPVQIKDLDGNTNALLILAVGLLLGLALGFLCILLYDTISDSLIDELGIKKLVGDQIPIWSTIPKIKKNNNHSNSEFGIYTDPTNQASVAFDKLAGIVQHRVTSNMKPVYCFSSLGYGESGVLTVLNLALSLMKNGKKVLMIGTNSGEIRYQDIYDPIIVSDPSVTRVSLANMDLDAVKKTDTKLPLLHLVCINEKPPELSMILNSEAFRTTVKSASAAYDIILIDGPTFRSPSNLLAVAKSSAGLVLNLRQGIASKEAMKQLLETVSISQVPILGIVFNAMFGRPSILEKHRIQKQKNNASLSVSKMFLPIQENKK